jgi:hypothetical protein
MTVRPYNRLGWFHSLAAVHTARAEFLLNAQQKNDALSSLGRALELIEKLRKAEPDNQRFKNDEEEIRKHISLLNESRG